MTGTVPSARPDVETARAARIARSHEKRLTLKQKKRAIRDVRKRVAAIFPDDFKDEYWWDFVNKVNTCFINEEIRNVLEEHHLPGTIDKLPNMTPHELVSKAFEILINRLNNESYSIISAIEDWANERASDKGAEAQKWLQCLLGTVYDLISELRSESGLTISGLATKRGEHVYLAAHLLEMQDVQTSFEDLITGFKSAVTN
jgi:hypothetical protein